MTPIRHQSVAELDDDAEVEITEDDLRVDTYRAGGAGGQHVNKTDSAIRLTHLATGIVVSCQSERSQHANRTKAMKLLRSRVYELRQDQKRQEMEKFYGEKGEIACFAFLFLFMSAALKKEIIWIQIKHFL